MSPEFQSFNFFLVGGLALFSWLFGAILFLLRVLIAGLSGAADMTFELLDLEVVFDEVDLATLSSIATVGHGSRGSAVYLGP